MSLEEMLREMHAAASNAAASNTAPASAEDLKKALADYSVTYDFKPGDIVRLKKNSGPYKPEFSPGIVMEIGVKGFPRESIACHGLEESMRVGVIAESGEFISFLVIPNYWEPAE